MMPFELQPLSFYSVQLCNLFKHRCSGEINCVTKPQQLLKAYAMLIPMQLFFFFSVHIALTQGF